VLGLMQLPVPFFSLADSPGEKIFSSVWCNHSYP
jgi:hypothetical protein